jgi:RimJ/RimL family protein N-acetyltransferase
MEFFPFRRDRRQSDEVMDRMRDEITENGFGWSAAEIAATDECIGFVGLNEAEIGSIVPPRSIEIGWRLAPEFWGRGLVAEAAAALLDFAFNELARNEIISFAVWNNLRSIAVMERLGMQRDLEHDFDNPRVPDTHPELKRHVLYRLTKESWQTQKRAAR